MRILQELLQILTETKLETKTADTLWGENSGSVSTYRTSAQYQVRKIPNSSPAKFEAFKLVGAKAVPFGKFTSSELKGALVPLRPNQTPDAEGYTIYIDREKVDAFQYNGDPIIVILDDKGATSKLSKGDYLVRTVDGDDFVFSIEAEADFESTLQKVK